MFITAAERTDLGLLGTRTWTTEQRYNLMLPEKEGCVLVWLSEDQALMPDLIVVHDGELDAFLAWAMTYVPQLCPITALVRVVEHRIAVKEVELATKAQRSSHRGLKYLRGCLGIVHAEVVAACQGSFAPYNAGLTPYLSTLSWLALQVQYLNAEQPLSNVHEAWNETRKLLDAKRLDYSSEIEEVWSIVADDDFAGKSELGSQTEQIREFLRTIAEGKDCERNLKDALKHAESIQAVRTGPLEGRMDVFRKLVQTMDCMRDATAIDAVMLGYALSQISQGSFSHVGLLGPDRVFDVRPLLWYGWFEFSRDNAEPSSSAVAAANFQLLRRIQELRTSPRRGNIALDELRVLSRLKDPFAECLLDVRYPISVEIIAGATTMVKTKFANGAQNSRKRQGQLSLFENIYD